MPQDRRRPLAGERRNVNRPLQITAPCRLHFGLLRFAQAAGPSYGGLGMMLDQPATVVKMQWADTWQATGPNAERALAFAQQAARHRPVPNESPIAIEVQNTPPAHTGLGSGTQLALAMARGVSVLRNRKARDRKAPTVDDLSASVGRGQRSAIGSHGFLHGGLLWETGRLPNEPLAKLTRRLDVPEPWRVLLITLPQDTGLHGSAELDAFAQLPPVPRAVTQQLQELAETQILPAVEQADFATFTESIYEYGLLAGSCFAPVQGGPYASADVAACIKKLRMLGLQGVGQSSWGPSIFAFMQDAASAKQWLDMLTKTIDFASCSLLLTAPNNQGSRVT